MTSTKPRRHAARIPQALATTAVTGLTALLALASGSLLIATPPALAQAQTSTSAADTGFNAAFARFIAARPGDEQTIDDAAQQFSRLSAAAPTDPVLRVYAGAATAMLATTTMLPWKKMSHAEDGLALIDKGLSLLTPAHDAASHPHSHQGVPAVLNARFTAASTFLALPSMFNRNERGRALLRQVTDSPLLDAAPAGFKAGVWMRAASLASEDKQPAQARQWLEKVAATATPQAAVARDKLKTL